MAEKIKVLVVDDSSLFRKAISSILATDSDIEVVGTAANGSIALKKIPQVNPNVITMDIEMPEMDGITALKEVKNLYPSISVIMFSVHTERGAEMTIDALSFGATDFVTKPSGDGSFEDKMQDVKDKLLGKIKGGKSLKPIGRVTERIPASRTWQKPMVMKRELIAIGSSTGGPNALGDFIPMLPKNINAGILITQHMPAVFTRKLAENLDSKSNIEVREAVEGDVIAPGLALIAPGGFHMVVKKSSMGENVVALNQDPPENHCRPSADVMFRSIAEIYKNRAIGVILTGMGQDGFLGMQVMKEQGSPIIAQNKESCVVWGMPRFVVEAGLADSEVDIKDVAEELRKYMI